MFDYKVQLSQWPEARPLSEVFAVDILQQEPKLSGILSAWGP